jgi:hypothetical protein
MPPSASEFENNIVTNGNGQDLLRPTTPGAAYATYPSSPQPTTLALPPMKGRKED